MKRVLLVDLDETLVVEEPAAAASFAAAAQAASARYRVDAERLALAASERAPSPGEVCDYDGEPDPNFDPGDFVGDADPVV